MPAEVLSPAQREAVIDFLTEAFHLPKTAPFVEPRLMHWKYDQPRPDWPGGRSYAWMEQGRIAAHACVCPVTYRVGDRLVRASYLTDWAASRKSPGAGVMLLRKLASCFEVLLAIGGSTDTQQILPKLGYRQVGELAVFARVVRPWRQFRSDPFPRGWKAPLRLARNVLWSRDLGGRNWARRAYTAWDCTPIAASDASDAPLLETPRAVGSNAASTAHLHAAPTVRLDAVNTMCPDTAGAVRLEAASTVRTPTLMNYLLDCPGAAMSAYELAADQGARGWFVLSRISGVMRLADLRVDSANPDDWRAAYACATQAASTDPQACELIAAASTPLAQGALRDNGFRLHHTEPVLALDPGKLLTSDVPLDVSLIDSDAYYLYDAEHPYLT